MTRQCIVFLAVSVCVSVAWASNPGEPLDCSDWVFHVPGISCAEYRPMGIVSQTPWFDKGSNLAFDNNGKFYMVTGNGEPQPSPVVSILSIVRTDGINEELVATISDRWIPGLVDTKDHIRAQSGYCGSQNFCDPHYFRHREPLVFDPVRGRLLIPLLSYCESGGSSCPIEGYGGGEWIAAFEGLGSLFEILQSYTPPSGPISFTVPAHPEVMASADWFDSYYIPMTMPLDWSLAQPLMCGFPATTPDPGDYLTVADTAPPLSPGQGYFYVTAASYQGERRYGRQRVAGVMQGRDPRVLPECM